MSHTPSCHVDLQAALANLLERLCRLHQAPGNLFPTVGEGTHYQLTENDNWLTGFWTGLLWLAYAATGDEQLRAHAEASLRYLLRPDGATYHTFFLDQETGAPIGPRTHQGYADDSLWARGQAWAIYGFALAAEWCQEERFLSAAQQSARRFMAELPPDGVPTWDLRLPADAPHYRDSSAGAIAAGGMLRLAWLDHEFRSAALALLDALVIRCLETQPEAQGLLRHGTYHAHKGWGVDAHFICGDYFFLEALLSLEGKAPDFWGPGDEP